LLETDADVEKLEKLVEGLEQKLTAAKQELETEKAKSAVQTKPEGTKNETVGQGKQRGGNWW
jgi:hypothetical protein